MNLCESKTKLKNDYGTCFYYNNHHHFDLTIFILDFNLKCFESVFDIFIIIIIIIIKAKVNKMIIDFN